MRRRGIYRIPITLAAVIAFGLVATLALGFQVNLLDAAGDPSIADDEPVSLEDGEGSSPEQQDACSDAAEEGEGCPEEPPVDPTDHALDTTATPLPETTETLLEEGTAEATQELTEPAGSEDDAPPTEEPTEAPPAETFSLQAAPLADPIVLQQAISNVSFTATVGANRTVQFTDLSSSDQAITGWLWNFGDGGTSTEQNPQHQYASDGIYPVTLTVTFADNTSLEAQGDVIVDSSQTGSMSCDFDIEALGETVPLTVNFINNSQNATSFAWNFGDGGTSTMTDPTHTYTDVGTYNITLTCTGPLGTLTADGQITVSETPGGDVLQAQFIASPTRGPAPLDVTVEDVSLGNVVSWTWTFGDGSAPVTGQGPHTHRYTAVGDYTITLTVTDGQGGTSTANGTISVITAGTRPDPSFTVSPQTGSAPLTVTVTDTSQGEIDTWTWTFGDGTSASGPGPHSHTYTTQGTFTIRLQVSGPGGAGSATRQVVVLPPGDEVDAIFSFQVIGSVPGGIEVCFTDQSVGDIASWGWNFGDGATSTDQNPCHVYDGPGNYTVTLLVTGTLGNTSTGTRIAPVVSGVPAPIASFTASSTDITVGQTVTFTNTSTGQITSYDWDFGDGFTSTEENPTHTYTTAGSFIVELRVTGPGGTSEAARTTITVREEAEFSCNFNGDTSPLLNQTVTYSARYTGLNGRTVASQSWTLSPGGQVSTGNSWQTTWTTPGQVTLTYTAMLEDGTDCSVTKTIVVADSSFVCVIDGPENSNAFQERRYTARLQGASGPATYAWTVDGQPFGNTQQITVIMPSGQSSLTLSVVITADGGAVECSVTRTVNINRGGEDRLVCDYTGDLTPLLNQTVTYTGTTEGLFNRTATYQWLINGQVVGTDSTTFTETWSTSDSFQLTFRVTPSEGEICEVTKTITVSNLTLECEIVGPFPARVGIPAVYEALVNGLGSRTASYEWFIDGSGAGIDSTITRTFNNTGVFNLRLRVTASDGDVCEVSRDINIEIGQQINAIANPNAGVAPLPVTFTAETTNIDRTTLVWHYPNGTTQAAEVGTFTFPNPGTFTVRVTGTGPLGQQEASVVVNVASTNDIRAAFSPEPFSGIAPLEVCFVDRSVTEGSTLNSWSWTFGDGNTSTEQNPCHTYESVGNFNVRLDVTNVAGLSASATNRIISFTVAQGSASFGFNIFPDGRVCFASFLMPGVTLDRWDFGDGTTSTDPNPCHTYTNEGDYDVAMWASGTDVHRTIRVQFDGQQEPPLLSLGGACTLTGAIFTISNDGGSMLSSDTYTVTNNGVEVARAEFQLGPGDQETIQVPGPGVYTLRVLGAGIEANTDCSELPQLGYNAVCAGPGAANFTATNSGGTMSDPISYQIVTGTGTVIESGTFQLPAGQSQAFSVSGVSGLVRLLVDGDPAIDVTCDDGTPPPPPTDPPPPPPTEPPATPPPTTPPPTEPPAPPPPAPPPVEPPDDLVCGEITEQPVAGGGPGFPLIDMNPENCVDTELPLASWTAIELGEGVCPEWFVYHTNQTGDWEIFRYGDLPDNPDADVNLSKGIGEQVYDIGPSRSPDAGWIAFASNRDENWEIYVATTDGEFQQRVTNNTRAIDYDPVWSPIGDQIIFESSRDGNWELYAVDVATGEQTRLTDNPANDLNAFWSPDGTRIVFESDRDGLWQVYELDLATLEVTLLSDGTANDQDPTYSMDGERVAFRSDRNGGTGVYVINRDGSELMQVSDSAGQATLPVFSPDDSLLAYQSDLNGQLDIYVYEFESETTRRVTDNASPNYAPTWYCDAPQLILTSDVTGDSNLFTTPALPIDGDPVTLIDGDGTQLTDQELADQHPQNVPSEENASRERSVIAPPSGQ